MENNNNKPDGIPHPRDQLSSLSNYASNGKIMLFSGIILFAAILIVLCFHSSARWIFYLRRRQARRRYILSLSQSLSLRLASASQGLDPSIMKALPVLVYSSKTHETVLECAVCLSEFQEGEEGRVLPACKHTFHSCCIDMWFHSHTNCPLCRSPVQHSVCKVTDDTVIPVRETADLQQKEEIERFSSASTTSATLSPLQCEKITPDLVGIVVEVPTSSGQQAVLGFPGIGSGPF